MQYKEKKKAKQKTKTKKECFKSQRGHKNCSLPHVFDPWLAELKFNTAQCQEVLFQKMAEVCLPRFVCAFPTSEIILHFK